jgi:AAA domain
MKPIIYLSKPLWQRGSFTLVTGKKNSGKSSMLVHEAARVTRGEFGSKDKVIWIALGEDSFALDVRPRLEAAGADTGKVATPDWRLELPRDIDELKRVALEHGGVGMIVIDPISGAVQAGRNTNLDNDVRATIGRLNNLAEELDSLLVGVRHLRKSARDDVIDAVMGSGDWVNIPRCVIGCAKDNEDENVCHIRVITGNRMPTGSSGLQFRLEPVRVLANGEPVVRAVLLGESTKDIGALLSDDATSVSKSRLAKIEILDRTEQERKLSDGGLESDNLKAEVASQFGLTARTVGNVITELKKSGLVWVYPEKDDKGRNTRFFVRRTNARRPESLFPIHDVPEATS